MSYVAQTENRPEKWTAWLKQKDQSEKWATWLKQKTDLRNELRD
jgi:hypothetical protein